MEEQTRARQAEGLVYVFLILSLDRQKIIHFNITANPSADWTSLQLIQAFPFESAPRFLIRDRDGIYGHQVPDTLTVLDIEQYLVYYHESRTHLGLVKDVPETRVVQALDIGSVACEPVLGGLRHLYYRDAT